MTLSDPAGPNSRPDYPAAHSMDTAWYAVDADGNIGRFETGEEGALPDSAAPAVEFDLLGKLQPLVSSGSLPVQLDDLFARPAEPFDALKPLRPLSPIQRLFGSKDSVRSGLILFRSDFPLDARKWKADLVIPTPHGQLAVLGFSSGLTWDEYQRLIRDGQILRIWSPGEMSFTAEPEPWRYGVYGYDHSDDFGMPGPYTRETVPPVPLRLDQLPEDVRAEVSRLRFAGLRFADTPKLQPFEHDPRCHTWEATEWMASDEKTVHPIPDESREL